MGLIFYFFIGLRGRNGKVKNWIVRGERNSDGINKWLLEKAIAPPKSGAGWVNGGVSYPYSSLSKVLLSDGRIFTKHDQ